ncbi:hypothetical protein ATANTOWER_029952 [Ataeniobius toweri]|uniref:Uncharacterized protein n=1 Tax=Ataeniobius toweri TaxID=208326 RepID=A0ABU7B1P5_9TELE|nr:hypothetical protein [Ataeniobius toweri]
MFLSPPMGMTERMRSRIQVVEISFLCRVVRHSLRDSVRSSGSGDQSRAAIPPCQEKSAEVAQTSVSDAPWTPPLGCFPGTSHQEEALGKAQDTLEGLCFSAGLETPWASPRGTGGGVWAEGRLGVSALTAALVTR